MRFSCKAALTALLTGVLGLAAHQAGAQQLTTLYNFCSQGGAFCTDGATPAGPLLQGSDGNFYGTTESGGKNQEGTVFSMTPAGSLTTLYSFCSTGGADCTDGAQPTYGLVEGPDGNFYGETGAGGNSETLDLCGETLKFTCGTVFKITPTGQLTTVYTFCSIVAESGGSLYCADGADPTGGLVLGSDGNFYGTAGGGFAPGFGEPGILFRLTPEGSLTVLYVFCPTGAPCGDGFYPSGGLTQGSDGNFYGTTSSGGTNGDGTIFRYNPTTGVFTTLAALGGATGGSSNARLLEGSDGSFYGTTLLYGNTGGTGGAIFRYTPGSGVSALHTFCSSAGCPDGYAPYFGLIQGTDGNFYGMTYVGGGGAQSECYVGLYGCGTIFRITPAGQLTTLHVFCSDGSPNDCTDGELPISGLVQGADSNFYGLAGGGTHGQGIAFSLVALVPTTTGIRAPGITYGGTAHVTLTVTSGGGTVTGNVSLAVDDGTPVIKALANGSATFTLAGEGGGAHALNAHYFAQSIFGSSDSAGTLTVNRAPVTLSWPAPAPIVYGTPLSATQLDATSSVPGSFEYSPAAGTVLGAGARTLRASFTPTDSVDYQSPSISTTITVNQKTPPLTWATPAAIDYGTALSSKQLDAMAKIPGTFAYSPAAGTILTAGSQTLSVVFTPTNPSNYTTATDSVTLTVNPVPTPVSWTTPEAIIYGTPLSTTQLDATATVPGSFVYSPPAGTVLGAGTHTLYVTFTATDTVDYRPHKISTTITVNQKTPVLTWATPAAIGYGTALSAKQLDAVAKVPGTFAYSPAAGAVLTAGTQTLTVTFTPTNTTDYTTATDSVTLTVNPVLAPVSWTTPAPITYPTPLSATQLDATSTVPGTFVYSPPVGTVLKAGTHTLTVTFTPSDMVDYKPHKISTTLVVNPAP